MNTKLSKKITDVVGIVLWTNNLDKMTAFYKDTLELPVHSLKADFVSFEFGNFRLNIGTHSEIKGASKDPLRTMLHLSVEDIDHWYRKLKECQVSFIRPPELEKWGRVATFPDPDGNTLQLLEFHS